MAAQGLPGWIRKESTRSDSYGNQVFVILEKVKNEKYGKSYIKPRQDPDFPLRGFIWRQALLDPRQALLRRHTPRSSPDRAVFQFSVSVFAPPPENLPGDFSFPAASQIRIADSRGLSELTLHCSTHGGCFLVVWPTLRFC